MIIFSFCLFAGLSACGSGRLGWLVTSNQLCSRNVSIHWTKDNSKIKTDGAYIYRLEDIYQSYYGGLTSVAWSPDGRYILVMFNLNHCDVDLFLTCYMSRLEEKMTW